MLFDNIGTFEDEYSLVKTESDIDPAKPEE